MKSLRSKSYLAVSLLAATIAAGAGALSAQTTTPVGDVKRGAQLYTAQGCYLCHNYQGQAAGSRKPGAFPGPNLAPAPIPYPAFVRQLRTPRQSMPPYDAKVLTDQEVADIYAFLAAQPRTKDWHSIALLTSVTTGRATNVQSGAAIYSTHCEACHGASGRGGTGPPLKGESTRKNADAVAAFIKNPPPPMPKLYPGSLSDGDVAAVSAYVESLH